MSKICAILQLVLASLNHTYLSTRCAKLVTKPDKLQGVFLAHVIVCWCIILKIRSQGLDDLLKISFSTDCSIPAYEGRREFFFKLSIEPFLPDFAS